MTRQRVRYAFFALLLAALLGAPACDHGVAQIADLGRPLDSMGADLTSSPVFADLRSADLATPVEDLATPVEDLATPVEDLAIAADLFDPCSALVCENGGTCVASDGTATCACVLGYIGDRCEDVDPCAPNPCNNGGACVASSDTDGVTCNCPSGWGGPTCNCPTTTQAANYQALESAQVTALDDVPRNVHITGSANINIVKLNGLGIAGGLAGYIDSGETMDVTFDFPAASLTLGRSGSFNVNVNADSYEITIEAFAPSGSSLGVKPLPHPFEAWSVTELYGGAPIGRIQIKGNPDGTILTELAVIYQCPEGN